PAAHDPARRVEAVQREGEVPLAVGLGLRQADRADRGRIALEPPPELEVLVHGRERELGRGPGGPRPPRAAAHRRPEGGQGEPDPGRGPERVAPAEPSRAHVTVLPPVETPRPGWRDSPRAGPAARTASPTTTRASATSSAVPTGSRRKRALVNTP